MSMNIINEEMVLAAIHKDLGSDATLGSWSQERCGKETDIFFNAVLRIRVNYMINGDPQSTLYVAKVNPCKKDDMFNPYRHHAVKKEIFFYKNLLPLLNEELNNIGEAPLKAPQCLYTTSEYGKEVLIFQDLRQKNFIMHERQYPMDADHAHIMMKELARLGGASHLLMEKHTNITEDFPYLIETWNCEDPALSVGFDHLFKKGVKFALAAAKCDPEYFGLVRWLEGLVPRALDTLKEQMKPTEKWKMICHGDYHRTNVMFKYNEENKPIDIVMLDWQTLRLSTYGMEINYTCYSSFSSAERKLYQQGIYDTYFNELELLLKDKLNFTKSELINHVENNHFGFLLSFYIIPLSLSVDDPQEMFIIDEKSQMSEPALIEKIKKLFVSKPLFKACMSDYAKEALRLDLPRLI